MSLPEPGCFTSNLPRRAALAARHRGSATEAERCSRSASPIVSHAFGSGLREAIIFRVALGRRPHNRDESLRVLVPFAGMDCKKRRSQLKRLDV
jgi:hypothetical protein